MYRVGIIGCGSISSVHARVLTELEDTQLAACADILPDRARKMAEQYGLRAYTDGIAMMDEEKLDAVHICTPHYLHPRMAEDAAERGLAVFTEKPPAIDPSGWQRVLACAEKVPVGVCFQNRYHPHILKLKRSMAEGTYGRLLGMRAFVTWNRGPGYYAAAGWKGAWATEGGGALINQAIHTLDLLVGFLGMPETAEADMARHRLRGCVEVEDTAEIYLCREGVPALLYASNGYSQDAPVIIELHFEKATLRLEGDVLTVIRDGERQEIVCNNDPVMGRSYWGAGHKACIRDFYASVTEQRPFMNAPASCDDTMRTLFKLYESGRKTLDLR